MWSTSVLDCIHCCCVLCCELDQKGSMRVGAGLVAEEESGLRTCARSDGLCLMAEVFCSKTMSILGENTEVSTAPACWPQLRCELVVWIVSYGC